jgi:hypothetical protein
MKIIKILMMALMLGLFGCQKEPINTQPETGIIQILEYNLTPGNDYLILIKLTSWDNWKDYHYEYVSSGNPDNADITFNYIKNVDKDIIIVTQSEYWVTGYASYRLLVSVDDVIKLDTLYPGNSGDITIALE